MWLELLRSCAGCSQSWGKIDFFCEDCWQRLIEDIEFQEGCFGEAPFLCKTFWRWSDKNKLLGKFVHLQKGQWLLPARRRVFERVRPFLDTDRPDFICCAIDPERSRDHGQAWARVFSEVLERPYFCLSLQPGPPQKSKTRKERLTQRSLKFSGVSGWTESSVVWFVDDVLTTGSTASAVWRALGKPLKFQAIALVYRSRLS